MNTIICASRKYENRNFDKLVDSFDIIVRNNMLLPDNDYGKRNSDVQVLNAHIYEEYKNRTSLKKWVAIYGKEYGIPPEHIKSFYKYLKLDTVKFQFFQDNNTGLMRRILKKHGIEHPAGTVPFSSWQQLRCGIGAMAKYIDEGIKPFLIGFGLEKDSALNKQYASKDGNSRWHDPHSEIDLIKKLHKADLVDATFCAIEDTQDIKVDSSVLVPTTVSLDMMKKVYK